ncbi:MAG: DUF4390 domain-containing protein [bacterium]
MNRKWFVGVLLFLLLLPHSGVPKGEKYSFGTIKAENGFLIFNFRIRDLVDKEIINGLQKGMTAAIEYQVQLWKDRPHWVNQLVAEKIVRMKVNYDGWERKYILATPNAEPTFLNEDDVRDRCSLLIDYPIAPIQNLEPEEQYCITIKIILQPMSMENVQEIKRWLAGEAKELNPKAITSSKSPGKKAGNWLLGLVLNLTGFGDRVISAKSPMFLWKDGTVVMEGKE